MSVLLSILLFAAVGLALWLWMQLSTAQRKASEKAREASSAGMKLAEAMIASEELGARVAALSRYTNIIDAENAAEAILGRAEAEAADVQTRAAKTTESAHAAALAVLQQARADAKLMLEQATLQKAALKAEGLQILNRAKEAAAVLAEESQTEVSGA